jgi:hypothetical protein
MLFDRYRFLFKPMQAGVDREKPYRSYEDIAELENPGFGLQVGMIVLLMLALYLVLKVRYGRTALPALGWICHTLPQLSALH